jgi:N6-L-threonylcarbamoyladenine synthase
MVRRNDYNFSYSGLKTECVVRLNKLKKKLDKDFSSIVPDFCASFQKTVSDSLLFKLKKVVEKYKPQKLLLGGGVVANNYIKREIRKEMRKMNVKVVNPNKNLCGDNAAMIGVCAYYKTQRKEFVKNNEKVDRLPNLRIDEKVDY